MADKEINNSSEELNSDAADLTADESASSEVTDISEADDKEPSAANAEKGKKSDKKSKKDTKKRGFFARIGAALKRFWKTMKSELKKVTWYSRKQTFTSTLLVLIVMAVAAVVIGLLDVGFSKGLEALANLF